MHNSSFEAGEEQSHLLQKHRRVGLETNVSFVLGNHNWQTLILLCVPRPCK